MTDRYLLPPYRCCGVSTRLAKSGGRYKADGYERSKICDICGWAYKKNGTGKRWPTLKKAATISEIDK